MALIEIKSDFSRLSNAMERIALSLERIADVVSPRSPATPSVSEEPRGLEALSQMDDQVEWQRQAKDNPELVGWEAYGPRQNY